jgi:hypothetical protein
VLKCNLLDKLRKKYEQQIVVDYNNTHMPPPEGRSSGSLGETLEQTFSYAEGRRTEYPETEEQSSHSCDSDNDYQETWRPGFGLAREQQLGSLEQLWHCFPVIEDNNSSNNSKLLAQSSRSLKTSLSIRVKIPSESLVKVPGRTFTMFRGLIQCFGTGE